MLVTQSCPTIPWIVVHQAPLSMEFSRQENWSKLPFPFPGDLPNPGIKPGSLALQADYLPSEPPGKPRSSSYDPKNKSKKQLDSLRVYFSPISIYYFTCKDEDK